MSRDKNLFDLYTTRMFIFSSLLPITRHLGCRKITVRETERNLLSLTMSPFTISTNKQMFNEGIIRHWLHCNHFNVALYSSYKWISCNFLILLGVHNSAQPSRTVPFINWTIMMSLELLCISVLPHNTRTQHFPLQCWHRRRSVKEVCSASCLLIGHKSPWVSDVAQEESYDWSDGF